MKTVVVGIAIIFLVSQWADATIYRTKGCNFELGPCGVTNQEYLGAQWMRKESDLGGKKATMMVLETNMTNPDLGRMITPYFEIYEFEKIACLTVEYFFSGDGAKSFGIQQEMDYGINSVYVSSGTSNTWQKAVIDIDIDKSLRFFFSAAVDPSVGDYAVAIIWYDVKFSRRCKRD